MPWKSNIPTKWGHSRSKHRLLIRKRLKLEDTILKFLFVLVAQGCTFIELTVGIFGLDNVKIIHLLLSIPIKDNFPRFVDNFQSIFDNYSNCLFDFSLKPWNCDICFTVHTTFQISPQRAVTGRHIQLARKSWNGPVLSSNRWGTFGLNSNTKELKRAGEHLPVEEGSPLGTLEVLETHNTNGAFCKSLLAYFRFWRSRALFLFFIQNTTS